MWSFTVLPDIYTFEDISLCNTITHLHFCQILTNTWCFGLPGFTKFACCQDVNKCVSKVCSLTWLEISRYHLFFGSSLECWQPLSLDSTFVFLRRCVSKNEWLKYIWDTSPEDRKGEREVNAVSTQGEPASTLCEAPVKTQFFRLVELCGKTERWEDSAENRLTEGSERRIGVTGAGGPLAVRLNWHHLWLRFYIWQCDSRDASRSWIQGNSCSLCNPCTATSNTHVRRVGLEKEYVPRPFLVLAVRVLAHDAPASAPQPSCFDPLHLPRSAAQMSCSEGAEIQGDPVLCSAAAKTKDPQYLSYVFHFDKPSTQQQQQQTTGGYEHICCSNLAPSHFIVWHTQCIKQQFTAHKGFWRLWRGMLCYS